MEQKLDYRTPADDLPPRRSRSEESAATAAGFFSLTAALLQVPWYCVAVIWSWLHVVGDKSPTFAQNTIVITVILIPTLIAIPTGLHAFFHAKRYGRLAGTGALIVIAFYAIAVSRVVVNS